MYSPRAVIREKTSRVSVLEESEGEAVRSSQASAVLVAGSRASRTGCFFFGAASSAGVGCAAGRLRSRGLLRSSNWLTLTLPDAAACLAAGEGDGPGFNPGAGGEDARGAAAWRGSATSIQ